MDRDEEVLARAFAAADRAGVPTADYGMPHAYTVSRSGEVVWVSCSCGWRDTDTDEEKLADRALAHQQKRDDENVTSIAAWIEGRQNEARSKYAVAKRNHPSNDGWTPSSGAPSWL